MPAYVPSVALRPDDLPTPGDWQELYAFVHTFAGYANFEMHAPEGLELRERYEARGPDALTLDELRGLAFITQRAHYHQGGAYPGGPDRLMERMWALAKAVGARLRRDGPPALGVVGGDITQLRVDAVVNAANPALAGGSGVDGAVHEAAGPELAAACRALPEVAPGVRCPVGEARVTPGFALPAAWVVHAVGPRWRGGASGEPEALASAYTRSLSAAYAVGAETVAVPALSTGAYGYPADLAAGVAVRSVRAWHAHTPLPRVALVGFDLDATRALRAAVGASEATG